ncbi:MAG TPA: tetratricopeptide repeat protein, partial [Candidatus Limnocylindrales bacterium]
MSVPTVTRPTAPGRPQPAWPDAAQPPVTTELIGRDALLTELLAELRDGSCRAVLLSGLGGVGTTRLAIEIADQLFDAFGGRVVWVSLAQVSRDSGLAATLAATLGLSGVEPDHVADAVASAIGRDPALLVLDGVETVLHDLALVDELTAQTPSLRIVLTSRIGFERPGVRTIAVDPLALPRSTDDADEIARCPAVQLLLDRAARAGADISVTPRNAAAIARLVAHLDGMPLALELAAPLLRLLPPHTLLERVRDGLDPIVATIDWAYDQLDSEDRRVYRRLAVFGVPFRVRHVRTFDERSVAHGLAPLGPDLSAALERLVRAGLLRGRSDTEELDAATGPDDPRGEAIREYELPALIRDDAMRRLEASGEVTAATWARANDLLALCELAHEQLVVRVRVDLLDQLDTVHDDILAALSRARAAGEGTFLLRMTGALAEYWRARSRLSEGRVWLDTAIRMGPPQPTPERARALHGAGVLANWQSDFARAKARLSEALEIRLALGLRAEAASTLNQIGLIALDQGELDEAEARCSEGLAIRRQIGDEALVAASLNTLGGVVQFRGRTDEARAMFEESVAIRQGIGDESGASVSLANLALVARDERDLVRAERMLTEAIGTRIRLGDRGRVAVVRHNLALVLFDAGDLDRARDELEAAISTARELGHRLELANALSDLGFLETTAGHVDRAAELQGEALSVAARIGAKGIIAQAIDGVAGIVAFRGDRCAAATLWSAADRIRRDAHYAMLAADRRRIEAQTRAARDAEPTDAWTAAWAAGEALSTEAAIDRAVAALAGR